MSSILLFVPSLGDNPLTDRNVSGHAQLPARFAAELAADGQDVRILTTGDVELATEGFIASPVGPSVSVTTLPDYKPHRPAAGASPFLIRRILATVHEIRPFLSALKSYTRQHPPPDVVHLMSSPAMLLALPLFRWRFRSSRIVFSFNDARATLPIRLFGSFLLRFTTAATAPSDFTADALRQQIRSVRLHVVRPGIPAPLDPPATTFEQRTHVAFVRYFTHEGGGDIAARVLAAVAPDLRGTKPIIAVRPHALTDTKTIDALAGSIPFFEHPSGPPVLDIVAQARCLVQPFRETTVDPQLTVIEAMRLGTPVVVSNIGPLAELVDDPRLVFEIEDEVGMARAVCRLCTEPEFFEDVSQRAQAASRRYSWQKYVEQMVLLQAGSKTTP